MTSTLHIYTDGSCWPNPGPGGYGVVVLAPEGRTELSGGEATSTNNRMELRAAIEALEALPQPTQVALHSDSDYVVQGMKSRVHRWIQAGWRTTAGTEVKNRDLWERLLQAAARHQVKWVWVRGHAGDPWNERADQLAGEARQRAARGDVASVRRVFPATPAAPPALTSRALAAPVSLVPAVASSVDRGTPDAAPVAAPRPADAQPPLPSSGVPSRAPLPIRVGEDAVPVQPWRGEVLAHWLSLCPLTTLGATDPASTPVLVMAAVFDGTTVYLVRREALGKFLSQHADAEIAFHDVGHAFWILERWLLTQADDPARSVLWAMAQTGRLHDTSLLDRLVQLANRTRTGTVGQSRSLSDLACALADLDLSGAPTTCSLPMIEGQLDYTQVGLPELTGAVEHATAVWWVYGTLLQAATAATSSHSERVFSCAPKAFGLLTESVQVRGAIALAAASQRGLMIDSKRVESLEASLQQEADNLASQLSAAKVLRKNRRGWREVKAGLKKALIRVVDNLRDPHGRRLIPSAPTNEKGLEISFRSQDWEEWRHVHPFLDTWLRWKEISSLRTFLAALTDEPALRTTYNVLVRTGRTSSRDPNVQNLPREGGVRECLRPRDGHVFLIADYRCIELVALAQIQLARYGRSALATTINAGGDPHRLTASRITGKPYETVTAEERQRAKAVNFGFPGGLGARAFVGYAKSTYGVTVSEEQAEAFRQAWLHTYPEMQYWLADEGLRTLAENLGLVTDDLVGELASSGNVGWIPTVVAKIASGNPTRKDGTPYSSGLIGKVWRLLGRARLPAEYAWRVRQCCPSPALGAWLTSTKAVTLTGRVRDGCTYTQARNTPFQGLAADGAKIALFELVRAGYLVVAFVHDEVVLEIPERANGDYEVPVEATKRIMIDAMQQVCPNVRVEVEASVSKRWSKTEGHLWPLASEDFNPNTNSRTLLSLPGA